MANLAPPDDYENDPRVTAVENALWSPFKSLFATVSEAAEALHDAAIIAVRALDCLERDSVATDFPHERAYVLEREDLE